MLQCIVILIGGGHASGKSSTVRMLQDELCTLYGGAISVKCLDLASYEDKSAVESIHAYVSSAISVGVKNSMAPLNPSRFDFESLSTDIHNLITLTLVNSKRVLLVHGLYALYHVQLRDFAHLKIFIDSDPDTRLVRVIRRDVISNCQPLQDVLHAYLQSTRSEHSNFIFPTKQFADVIMPRGAELQSARLILDGIKLLLDNPGPELIAKHWPPHAELHSCMLDTKGFDRQVNEYYETN